MVDYSGSVHHSFPYWLCEVALDVWQCEVVSCRPGCSFMRPGSNMDVNHWRCELVMVICGIFPGFNICLEVSYSLLSDDHAYVLTYWTDIQAVECECSRLYGSSERRQVDWIHWKDTNRDFYNDTQLLGSGILDNSEVCLQILGHQELIWLQIDWVCSLGNVVLICDSNHWRAIAAVLKR